MVILQFYYFSENLKIEFQKFNCQRRMYSASLCMCFLLLAWVAHSTVTFSKEKIRNSSCVTCAGSDCHTLSNDVVGILVEAEIATQWKFRCLKQSDTAHLQICEGHFTINQEKTYELGDYILSDYQHLKIDESASEIEIINLMHPKL